MPRYQLGFPGPPHNEDGLLELLNGVMQREGRPKGRRWTQNIVGGAGFLNSDDGDSVIAYKRGGKWVKTWRAI